MFPKINSIFRVLFLVFIGLLIFTPIQAQQPFWTTPPNAPAKIYSSYEVGNTVIIGTVSGVYRLSNDGTNWISSNTGLPEKPGATYFFAHGNTLFINTEKGYFKSSDQANTWIPVTVPSGIYSLYSSGAILYALILEPAPILHRSLNNGESWEVVTDKFPVTSPLVIVGNDLFVYSRTALFRSSDNAQSWKELKLPENAYIWVLGSSDGILYLTGFVYENEPNRIWSSANRGNSWDLVRKQLPYTTQSLIVSGANMIAIRSKLEPPMGLYQWTDVSSDAGRTWESRWFAIENYREIGGPFVADLTGNVFLKGNSLHITTASTGLKINRNFMKPTVAAVSAANYKISPLSNESIVSVFGSGFALTTAAATSVPLPTSLENTSVTITDSTGVEKIAPLFYISPTQINFQIPAGLANGVGTATVNLYNQIVGRGVVSITNISPGLFTVNQTGEGFAAANVQRVKADGTSIFEPIAQFNSTTSKFTAIPINVSSPYQAYLNLYGTGIRGRSNLANVKATVEGVDVPVVYAGAHGSFVGVDQINVLLPSSLAGKGEVEVVLTVDGQIANAVRIAIQ